MNRKQWEKTALAAGVALLTPAAASAVVVEIPGIATSCSTTDSTSCDISFVVEETLIQYTLSPFAFFSAGATLAGNNPNSAFHFTNDPEAAELTTYVTNFAPGSNVGSGLPAAWTGASTTLAELKVGSGCVTDFACDGTPGYIGLRFSLGPEGEQSVHFGYAKVGVNAYPTGGSEAPLTAEVQVYSAAYEAEAGADIAIPGEAVPEPGTLGMLALGAAGLVALRLRRRA